MKQWLKDQWPTFIAIILGSFILYFIFHNPKRTDDLNQYKIDEKQTIIDILTHENDSLLKVVANPIPDNTITDSLLQISIDINNKTLNELRKKRNAVIDTLDSSELQRIFSGYH